MGPVVMLAVTTEPKSLRNQRVRPSQPHPPFCTPKVTYNPSVTSVSHRIPWKSSLHCDG